MTADTLSYIAAGGNRHPSAADWAPGLLAFGAGNNIALWDPSHKTQEGVVALLSGHAGSVSAVKIYDMDGKRHIVSGSNDKTLRSWTSEDDSRYEQRQCLTEHKGSINTICTLTTGELIVSGSADGVVNIWKFSDTRMTLSQSIQLRPHFLPLTSAIFQSDDDTFVLAIAGTTHIIQIYASHGVDSNFTLQATLTGHEGWVRSLDFVRVTPTEFLLASASQDKYIRLWRFRCDPKTSHATSNGVAEHPASVQKSSLTSKIQLVGNPSSPYIVTFEALLVGHEDWIYTVKWAPTSSEPRLLSVSADNSLAIWQADEQSGVWVCHTRLGEISALKGSTTATGSTGGFWIGLWSPDSEGVVSLGRTGSWRQWQYEQSSDTWTQTVGLSGHTREVRGLAWAADGSYLMSTSADQTTRLFAQWKRNDEVTWHEFARPQIHGYDLNCIGNIGPNRFISGADEKLLRVFDKPRAVGDLLSKLCGARSQDLGRLPDSASIPVLGLSNKAVAVDSVEDPTSNGGTEPLANGHDSNLPQSNGMSSLSLELPPFEEHLSRQTLWPEHEKLYGHGFEISAVAANHDGSLVATACKASSLEHAVIRIYECRTWREVKPALPAHSLTVTALEFSPDDQHLLSVGRDRQWAVFTRDESDPNTFTALSVNLKGHARMILDCSWAPLALDFVFATAGRDKLVKIWRRTSHETIECISTIEAATSVTSIAFAHTLTEGKVRLAFGTENGRVRILDIDEHDLKVTNSHEISQSLLPSGAVTALRWRPQMESHKSTMMELAIASEDSSVRILEVEP